MIFIFSMWFLTDGCRFDTYQATWRHNGMSDLPGSLQGPTRPAVYPHLLPPVYRYVVSWQTAWRWRRLSAVQEGLPMAEERSSRTAQELLRHEAAESEGVVQQSKFLRPLLCWSRRSRCDVSHGLLCRLLAEIMRCLWEVSSKTQGHAVAQDYEARSRIEARRNVVCSLWASSW